MPKASSLTYEVRVTAKSPYGIKADDGEEWLNWSLEKYREEPWEADDVQKGDWVQIKRSGNFIKSIQLVDPPAEEGMVRRGSENEEDAFEGMELEPIESRARNPIATEREQSIQKQVALKCAVELALGMLGPEGQKAGPINAAWVVAVYKQFAAALNE